MVIRVRTHVPVPQVGISTAEHRAHYEKENRKRAKEGDPLVGKTFQVMSMWLGKFVNANYPDFYLVGIKGSFEDHAIIRDDQIWDRACPFHISGGPDRDLARFLSPLMTGATKTHTIKFRKWGGPSWEWFWRGRYSSSGKRRNPWKKVWKDRTGAYIVSGGSILSIFRAAERAGFAPPTGHWHVSL